jgi:hypothetical protein
MKKHTSGPWKVLPEECDNSYIRIRGTVLGGRYKIANVITPVYPGVPEFEAQETRANARLIAAAPDLLEALKQIAATKNLAKKLEAEWCPAAGLALVRMAEDAIAKIEEEL